MRKIFPAGQAGLSDAGGLFAPGTAEAVLSAPPGAEGHRARVRARLLAAGAESVADHEVLELVLFLALPRRDTKQIAKQLIARFGSYANVISAPPADLLAVKDMGPAAVAALRSVLVAAQRLARAEIADRPLLTNWDRLMEYLTAMLARERVEHFRVLYLDNRNRLLADEQQGSGTVNHTPVYPREVVRRAIELHASALIMVHNHPSGDPRPSAADVAMTREVSQAARALSLTLHDHVIIGNGAWVSLRREGLLED